MKRIGWIGTGVMGASMVRRLLAAGFEVTVSTRRRAKAEPLLAEGARWADSPAQAVSGADVAATMVGYPHDVESVYLGSEGVFAVQALPALAVDFTTSSPDLAARLAAHGAELGVPVVDAPVSGGDIGARTGALSIMMGGEASAVEALQPMLKHLGKTTTHLGGPGAGQHTKMVNQILIASTMVGVCEGLLYARAAGLDGQRVIEAVGSGAAGSWTINNLGPRMLKRDFEPGFYVEHFLKDLGIALAEARRLRLALPGLAQAEQLYRAVEAQGMARKGTQALICALESLSAASPGASS